jgi:hypothetical protein
MSEQLNHNDSLPAAADEQDLPALIKKMQQQLGFLEKKIDLLIEQSARRPFSEKPFSKPSRNFGRPHRPFERAHDGAAGEKRFERGRHFEKRSSEDSRRFEHKKKPFENSREGEFSQDRNFAKRNEGQKEGFDYKKKPFHFKRRERG